MITAWLSGPAAEIRSRGRARRVLGTCYQDLTEFDRGQRVATRALTEDSVEMEFLTHDPVAQAVTYQRVTLDAQGTTLRLRYCWPSELDLMARLAGMRLRERYKGWDRSPFTAASQGHVSVYEVTAAPDG
jgi:hypothetical protein